MMSFIISCGELGVKRSENKFGLLSMLGRQNQMWDFFLHEIECGVKWLCFRLMLSGTAQLMTSKIKAATTNTTKSPPVLQRDLVGTKP